ncbi:hypothetical protein HYX16_04325 [Candidatus Woesearchaeota archaeon]|nr:hypothetical protein [Candidatus Woesearchaeota archaeon]
MVNLAELIERTPYSDRHKRIDIEPYGPLVISPEGEEIIKLDIETTEAMLTGLHNRIMDILEDRKSRKRRGRPELESDNQLGPHIKNIGKLSNTFLGSGSEGSVFRFYLGSKPVAIKFYCGFKREYHDSPGINQFLALQDISEEQLFRTPVPYFATPCSCVMEDFSAFTDYFEFVRNYPSEKGRLLKYLTALEKKSRLSVDVGDIYTGEGRHRLLNLDEIRKLNPRKKASIFIAGFNPKAKINPKRYKFGVVDISII